MKTCTQCNQRVREDGSGLERELVEHLETLQLKDMVQIEKLEAEVAVLREALELIEDKMPSCNCMDAPNIAANALANTSPRAEALLNVVAAAEEVNRFVTGTDAQLVIALNNLETALKKYRETK